MKTKNYEKEYSFDVQMNPNLKGITKEDLDEQFELANKIMRKTSIANEAIIRIREIKAVLDSAKTKISSSDFKKVVAPFLEKISGVEEELYQVKNQSNQDPLNFPIKLNNRLASLRRSMENGEAKPTDGAYKVFGELSDELQIHMDNLKGIFDQQLPVVNAVLTKAGSSLIKT